MMFVLFMVTLLVAVYLLYPITARPISFDEKDEVIHVYREELAYIEQQHKQQLLNDHDKQQLLDELEQKSVLAMLALDKKTFAYRHSMMPVVLIALVLGASVLVYGHFYEKNGVAAWQLAGETYHDDIKAGLFDAKLVESRLSTSDNQAQNRFCFLLQHAMLKHYPKHPNALVNVAECHLQLGYDQLANTALAYALRAQPDHLRANYVVGQLQFLQSQRLTPKTQTQLDMLFAHHPDAVDIGYLLMLNHFAQGESAAAERYAQQLSPHINNHPELKSALEQIKANLHPTPVSPSETAAHKVPAESVEKSTITIDQAVEQ